MAQAGPNGGAGGGRTNFLLRVLLGSIENPSKAMRSFGSGEALKPQNGGA